MQRWFGRVYMNPPYGTDVHPKLVEKLVTEYERGVIEEAILLVGNRTETEWFQPLYRYLLCFVDNRIAFESPVAHTSGPVVANVFVYFGRNPRRIVEVFSAFGTVVRKVTPDDFE
jgi:hypothetical protein